jgi:RNA polymerase sigma factor (sigma-70 family)
MHLKWSHKHSKREEALVSGCIRNDRKAQKELYDQYKIAMYSTTLRILNNPDVAHDALQDAFIDVFENICDFRFESTLGSWIKTIVIRKALRWLRLERYNEPLDIVEKIEAPEWNDNFNAEYLEKAIQSLPASARTVFILIEVEGYKHQEVAEILSISVGTSKSQLYYAKKLLQKKLSELDRP